MLSTGPTPGGKEDSGLVEHTTTAGRQAVAG
jgi:hypothetical protein